MSGKYTGAVGIKFAGDQQVAFSHAGRALLLAGQCADTASSFGGAIGRSTRREKQPDGSIIDALAIVSESGNIVRAWITSPQKPGSEPIPPPKPQPGRPVPVICEYAYPDPAWTIYVKKKWYAEFDLKDMSDLRPLPQFPTGIGSLVFPAEWFEPGTYLMDPNHSLIARNDNTFTYFRFEWTNIGSNSAVLHMYEPFEVVVPYELSDPAASYPYWSAAVGDTAVPYNVAAMNDHHTFLFVSESSTTKLRAYSALPEQEPFIDIPLSNVVGGACAHPNGVFVYTHNTPTQQRARFLKKYNVADGVATLVWENELSRQTTSAQTGDPYTEPDSLYSPPLLPNIAFGSGVIAEVVYLWDSYSMGIHFSSTEDGSTLGLMPLRDAVWTPDKGVLFPIALLLSGGSLYVSLHPTADTFPYQIYDVSRGRVDVYTVDESDDGAIIPNVFLKSIMWSDIMAAVGTTPTNKAVLRFLPNCKSSFYKEE